jgi:hypothetical protein
MSETDKTSVAALISVILRRKANRIIDVKWLVKNQEYAREIINLSREQGQDDLNEYASHLEKLMFGSSSVASSPVSASPAANAPAAPKPKPFVDSMDKSSISSWGEAPKFSEPEDGNDDDDGGEIDTSKYVGHLR